MEVYDEKPFVDNHEKLMDWNDEYNKVKFSTPYLVYKMRPIWIILD